MVQSFDCSLRCDAGRLAEGEGCQEPARTDYPLVSLPFITFSTESTLRKRAFLWLYPFGHQGCMIPYRTALLALKGKRACRIPSEVRETCGRPEYSSAPAPCCPGLHILPALHLPLSSFTRTLFAARGRGRRVSINWRCSPSSIARWTSMKKEREGHRSVPF